ncbi:hypothetical protein CPAR01_05654 [Colletotrichum paranaense]|uniref:Uncharacterized protein n=1 Tax=Colletotrichum paranaense TaxID=1914294 RepID=A0ABQ9SRV7_9PEZI|nr:uncharacterized protein CPAR01_05654 [Colletotrichum paranaense]KAK1542267.1 hypothetical protein CPAR01_05654 [Colletotrichum paranaense]
MAKLLPSSAELRGIDMDTTKFPPPSDLPPNIFLLQHNALKTFSEEMHGSFDMIHIRLIGLECERRIGELWRRMRSRSCAPGGTSTGKKPAICPGSASRLATLSTSGLESECCGP